MKKGILILAIGHPNYGKMAAALAAAIKATQTGLPIHLAYNETAITHLSEEEMRVFSSIKRVPETFYKPAYIRAKVSCFPHF